MYRCVQLTALFSSSWSSILAVINKINWSVTVCAVNCTVDRRIVDRTPAVIDQIARYSSRIAIFAYPTCTLCKKSRQKNLPSFRNWCDNGLLRKCAFCMLVLCVLISCLSFVSILSCFHYQCLILMVSGYLLPDPITCPPVTCSTVMCPPVICPLGQEPPGHLPPRSSAPPGQQPQQHTTHNNKLLIYCCNLLYL